MSKTTVFHTTSSCIHHQDTRIIKTFFGNVTYLYQSEKSSSIVTVILIEEDLKIAIKNLKFLKTAFYNLKKEQV